MRVVNSYLTRVDRVGVRTSNIFLSDSNDNLEATDESGRVKLVKIVYPGVLVESRGNFGLNRDRSGAFWSFNIRGYGDLRNLEFYISRMIEELGLEHP